MKVLYCHIILFCGLICNGVELSKIDEGYPVGYLPVCLGSTKPAEIAQSQLKYLQFITQGLNRSRRRYNYWNAHQIALDPRMDFKRKTMLLALGYIDSPNFLIARVFAGLYEDLGYNVILVDNQRFSTVHYFLASRLMRPVGKHVAEILANLTLQGLEPSKLELLGFSLGGHTIGFIAKNYRNLTGKNISRLTALEPSGPCFRTLTSDLRLDSSDADFVDVLHTNIDGFGIAAPLGHVNFYVNGGEFQPSNLDMYPCTTTCSHFRSLFLWVSSLNNPGKFLAVKCDSVQSARNGDCYDRVNSTNSTNVMGLNTHRDKIGVYYLATSNSYPYYLGEHGLRKQSWEGSDVNGGNHTVIYV